MNKKHIYSFISLVAISTIALVFTINNSTKIENNNDFKNSFEISNTPNTKPVKDEIITMTISSIGDIMAHSPQLEAQYNSSINEYSFHNNFKEIKEIITSTDLALTNLETTLGESNFSGYPQFKTPDSIVDAIKECGFDVISLINNHSADTGRPGLTRTLNVVREQGLDTIGIKKDSNEKDYIIKEVSGFKLGLSAYSYGTITEGRKYLNGNPVPGDMTDLTNVFDTSDVNKAFDQIKPQIDEIKKENVDAIILFIHWGDEYQREPNSFQKELAQKLCNEGVDIIIGSHPHVVQPIELICSDDPASDKQTLVIYSLGNAISNQRREHTNSKYTEDGVIPIITLEKNITKNETQIKNVEYTPTWVYKFYDEKNNKYSYEILPITNEILKSHNSIREKLLDSYKSTTGIIGNTGIIKPKAIE